jgi:hypothetical protein
MPVEPKKVLYSCVKLDHNSCVRLLRASDKFNPLHSVEKAHHMTIRFGKQDVAALPLGQTVKLKVVGYAYNEGVQAVHVQVEDATLDIANTFPHVTVSHSSQGKPKDSNPLLESTEGGLKVDGPVLFGTVGYYLRSNAAHFVTH